MPQMKPWEVTRFYTDKLLIWADSEERAIEDARGIPVGVETERLLKVDYTITTRELTEKRG